MSNKGDDSIFWYFAIFGTLTFLAGFPIVDKAFKWLVIIGFTVFCLFGLSVIYDYIVITREYRKKQKLKDKTPDNSKDN